MRTLFSWAPIAIVSSFALNTGGCAREASTPAAPHLESRSPKASRLQKPASSAKTSSSTSTRVSPGDSSASPGASPADVARWPATVRAAYDALRSSRGDKVGLVIKGVLRLAREGGAALPALRALHADAKLPARVRTMAGVMFANLNRFSPEALYRLLSSSQSHVARHAALLLSQLGPDIAQELLRRADKLKDPKIATAARYHASHAVARQVSPRTLELLHTLLTSTDQKKKQWAGTELAVSHIKDADYFLRSLLHEAVADTSTRLQAALALVEGHAKDVAKLYELAGRQYAVNLRLAACRQLATLGAKGKAALYKLAKEPNDPLAAQIEALAKNAKGH